MKLKPLEMRALDDDLMGSELDALAERVIALLKRAASDYLAIGGALAHARLKLKTERLWLGWLAKTGLGCSQAYRLIAVWKAYGSSPRGEVLVQSTSLRVLSELSRQDADPAEVQAIEAEILGGQRKTVAEVTKRLAKIETQNSKDMKAIEDHRQLESNISGVAYHLKEASANIGWLLNTDKRLLFTTLDEGAMRKSVHEFLAQLDSAGLLDDYLANRALAIA